MTGHEHLLAMRRSGYKPAFVFVMDSDNQMAADMAADWHKEPNAVGKKLMAHIRVKADDVPESLDFRCVFGLPVHLESYRSKERLKRLFKALQTASPSFLTALDGKELLIYPETTKNGADF